MYLGVTQVRGLKSRDLKARACTGSCTVKMITRKIISSFQLSRSSQTHFFQSTCVMLVDASILLHEKVDILNATKLSCSACTLGNKMPSCVLGTDDYNVSWKRATVPSTVMTITSALPRPLSTDAAMAAALQATKEEETKHREAGRGSCCYWAPKLTESSDVYDGSPLLPASEDLEST